MAPNHYIHESQFGNEYQKEVIILMEKIYHTMRSVGVWNLVLGILMIVSGIIAGILLILNGSILLKKKSELMF